MEKVSPEVFDFHLVERSSISPLGKRIFFRVETLEDLNAIIVKSDSAEIRILEVDLEIPAGRGRLISILEFLKESYGDLETSSESLVEGEQEEQVKEFLTKLKKLMEGEVHFTLVLNDPLSRSWIQYENHEGRRNLIVEEFQRTLNQDEEYDLEHIITNPFVTDGDFEIGPFEVAHEDGLPFKQYQALFDVERWYDTIKEFTFKTSFLPLTLEDAKCLVSLYENQTNGIDSAVLGVLEQKIDDIIKGYPNGAVVRLSTRSPKDAIQHSAEFKTMFANELKDNIIDSNTSDIIWYSCNVKAMKFLSGKHAVSLLASSLRAHDDLERWIQFPDFEMNIIIRSYHYIQPSMEFRCFVHNGNLTAMSQYITVCFFQDLKEQKLEVELKLKKFFERSRETISKLFKSYVVDLAILEDGEVVIIEINPFWNKTGPALFNWQEDRDVIAVGKDSATEFRIVEVEWMRKKNYLVDVRDTVEHI